MFFLIKTTTNQIVAYQGTAYSFVPDGCFEYNRTNGMEGLTETMECGLLYDTDLLDVRDKTSDEKRSCLLDQRQQEIDEKTDELIATDTFEYGGVDFKCDLEHQSTFLSLYSVRNLLTYPYTIKGVGTGFVDIENADEFQTFYLTGLQYVETILQTGWYYKYTVLPSLTLAELEAWEDPR